MQALNVTLPPLTPQQERALLTWMQEEACYSVSQLVGKLLTEELARHGEPQPVLRVIR